MIQLRLTMDGQAQTPKPPREGTDMTDMTDEPIRAGATAVISIRIPAELKARLIGLRYGPYRVGVTDVVIRGIELALAEIEERNA